MPKYMRIRVFVAFCVVLYLALAAALLFLVPGGFPGFLLITLGGLYLAYAFFDSFWHWVQTGHVCVFTCYR